MKKILHICVGYGGTKLYAELFHRLHQNQFSQFIYYPRRKTSNFIEFNKLPYDGYSPLIHKKWMKLFYFLKIKSYTKKLKNYFQMRKESFNDFNLIHAHTLFSDGGTAYKLSKKTGIKYIVAVRHTDLQYLKYMPFLKNYGKKIICSAEKLICLSPTIKKEITAKYLSIIPNIDNKTTVIPNAITPVFLENNLPNKFYHKKNKISLLYVGSFQKLKKIPQLIKFVKQQPERYQLKIIGKGGFDYDEVRKLSNQFNNIEYIGQLTDIEKLKQEYRNAEIFIMLSVTETFGLVYIEAISQGTPIIYSKGTGIDGIFAEGEVGFGINPNNYNKLDEKINLIISNYTKISMQCIKKSKDFDWNKISNEYINIYNQIISS